MSTRSRAAPWFRPTPEEARAAWAELFRQLGQRRVDSSDIRFAPDPPEHFEAQLHCEQPGYNARISLDDD